MPWSSARSAELSPPVAVCNTEWASCGAQAERDAQAAAHQQEVQRLAATVTQVRSLFAVAFLPPHPSNLTAANVDSMSPAWAVTCAVSTCADLGPATMHRGWRSSCRRGWRRRCAASLPACLRASAQRWPPPCVPPLRRPRW